MAAEQGEAQVDEAGAVGAGLVRDRADEGGFGVLHFGDGFGDAVLADDGDVAFALVFADGVDGTEGGGVGSGGDEDVLVAGMAIEEVGDELAGLVAEAATVHAHEDFGWKIGAAGADSFEGSSDAALDEGAGFGEVKAEDPVDFAGPLVEGMGGKSLAGFDADAIVVDAEVGGVGMRDVDGDEGDVGCGDLVADDGGDFLLDLELDDEVDTVVDELFGVADGGGAVVVVVEDEEVDADGGCGGFEALGDFDGEGHLGTLAGETETDLFGRGDVAVHAVRGVREVAAVDEGFKDAVDGGLGDARLAVDGFEGHRLIFSLEKLEDVDRLGKHGDEIEAFCRFTCWHCAVLVGRLPQDYWMRRGLGVLATRAGVSRGAVAGNGFDVAAFGEGLEGIRGKASSDAPLADEGTHVLPKGGAETLFGFD